jgi:hypothetical protein
MSQGPVAAAGPESAAALDEELLEPPSEPEVEPELPLEPGPLELALEPELPLEPGLPLDPELDDSLVSSAGPASGDELVELAPLDPHA